MANQFHAGSGYFIVGNKFDSRNRYIRAVANPADRTVYMCRGPSISMTAGAGGNSGNSNWRWQVGPATKAGGNTVVAAPSGFNTTINAAI